jgi:SAM-dependent methyltransferase
MIALAVSAGSLTLVALAIELGRARRRLLGWPVLAPADTLPTDDIHVLLAPGVQLDDAVRRAAAARVIASDLEALDLVPADLDVGTALELVSVADPSALAIDPFARTAGAGHAIVVRGDLIQRANLETPRDASSLAAAAERLRRFAVGRTGTAIAPGLHAVPEVGRDRAWMLRARTGIGMGPRLYIEGVRWALLAVALIADLRVGLVVLVLASISPSLVFIGLPLQPGDRWRSLIERVPRDLLAWVRACMQHERSTSAVEVLRPVYAALVADGTGPFFAARRDRCPHCGDSRLAPHIVTTDLPQRKPGRFTLERCAACDLIFQNPALSPKGLDFYYRDFYDGLNAELLDEVFASTHPLYTSRVATVIATGVAPTRWLDLGCGYAHFSLAARRELPATRFEGLDRSPSVDEAVRRGWIDRAWRQTTGEVALEGERFDVVSLFHYLEHMQDPGSEITSAAQLLTPGGRLILEIPNPRCRLGRILGHWWFPWFQPQHQMLLGEAAVRRLLAAADLEPVSVTYLMTAGDMLLSAILAVRRICSPGDVPWAPRPSAARRALDVAIWAAACPIFVCALIADAIYGALPPSPTTSNALRVVAAPRRS